MDNYKEPSEIDSWLRSERRPNVTLNMEEVHFEQVAQYNRERSALQGAFTRTSNKLNDLLADENADINAIEDMVNSLDKTYQNLIAKVTQIQRHSNTEEKGKLELYKDEISEKLCKVKSEVQTRRQDAVKPGDSASQAMSSTSSTKSKVAAKKAALQENRKL